ncbi:MAG: hypothetical protein IT580_01660 [Verrucomicrobiales bacterium]|nr:hypothetical protein [Verrucomicrobiales bacterium]
MNATLFLPTRDRTGTGTRPTLAPFEAATIRIPVTPGNRTRLRQLRARELQPWIASGLAPAPQRTPRPGTTGSDRESQAILVVLGTAALALLLQSNAFLTVVLEQWDSLREVIATRLL